MIKSLFLLFLVVLVLVGTIITSSALFVLAQSTTQIVKTSLLTCVESSSSVPICGFVQKDQNSFYLVLALANETTSEEKKVSTSSSNRILLPSVCLQSASSSSSIINPPLLRSTGGTSSQNNIIITTTLFCQEMKSSPHNSEVQIAAAFMFSYNMITKTVQLENQINSTESNTARNPLFNAKTALVTSPISSGGIMMFNKNTLDGCFFRLSSSSIAEWTNVRDLIAVPSSPSIFVPTMTHQSSPILVRINNDSVCVMKQDDDALQPMKMTCGDLPKTSSIHSVVPSSQNINSITWSPFTNLFMIPASSSSSSSSSSSCSSNDDDVWGYCGTQLMTFSSDQTSSFALSSCQASESGIPFTKFNSATFGAPSSVVSTIPSAQSPKRLFQMRKLSSGTFVLLSIESLAFLGVDAFASACSANPPQVTWAKSFSSSSTSPSHQCIPTILTETTFQLLVKNSDCTISALDVENGDPIWTSQASSQKLVAVLDPVCQTTPTHRSIFSEAVLIDYETKVAFIEAVSGDLKILNMSNGALIRSIPDTPAVAHCLSNAINNGNPSFASASSRNGFIDILTITADQGETRVIQVSTNSLIAGGGGANDGETTTHHANQIREKIMKPLIQFSFKPSSSWKLWNSIDQWSGIYIVPGTLNNPDGRLPLWEVDFHFYSSSQNQAPFQLIMIDRKWSYDPLTLKLINVNVISSSSTLNLVTDFYGTVLEMRNLKLLEVLLEAPICAPAPAFSFTLADVPNTDVQLLPNSQRQNCLSSSNKRVYSSFEVTGGSKLKINTSSSTSSTSFSTWQNLFMSVAKLTLRNTQLSGSLQTDLSPNQFSIKSTPLTQLDLSNNPQITGYFFDQIWPYLRWLKLANTNIQSHPNAAPYAFKTHLIPCDSHYRYSLVELDVSGCSDIRGIFAVSAGERTCLPVSLTKIRINGTSIVDAIDLRITSNSTSAHFEKRHAVVDIFVNPSTDLRERNIKVVCGKDEEQVPSILVDATTDNNNNAAWDPCNTTEDTPTSVSKAPSFKNIDVVDATDSRLWLPMRPFCVNLTFSYLTGNYLPFTSATETIILNNTGVLFQIYPSLVREDEETISLGGSPARISDATVQARVNSFSSFTSTFDRSDIRCGVVPLHWWLVSKPPLNQNNNVSDDTTKPQIVDLVFQEAIRSNLTSCLNEILMFEFYQPGADDINIPTTTTTATTTSEVPISTTSTTNISSTTSTTFLTENPTGTTPTTSTLLPSSTTIPSSTQNHGTGGGQGNSQIDIQFTLKDLTLQVIYLPITNNATRKKNAGEHNTPPLLTNYDAQIIINTTASVIETNLTTNASTSFDASYSYLLDEDGQDCPSNILVQQHGYCLEETPPTYHRVDFYTEWINMSKIETGTNPSELKCAVPQMQATVLADGRVYPWSAFQSIQSLCAPKQFALSGSIRNCSLYPTANEADTLYCVGLATGGSVRRSTYSTSFCKIHWNDVPLCEASREVDTNLLGGDVTLSESFFKSTISGSPSSTVFSACSADTHSSQGVGVAGFVRTDRCVPLSAIFPPPYKQLDSNIQRSNLQELLQACRSANQCSFYDETSGQLVCDRVSSKLRLLALCFAVRGYNVSVAESVLRKITTVIKQNCSLTAADDPNNPYDASKFYRETVALFSLSVENIFVRMEFDELHDMTHFVWCNPPTDGGLETTTPVPGISSTSTTTISSTTTTTAPTTTPTSSPKISTQQVVWSFPNGECVTGIRITTSMCRPYIEPHVFPLSYTSFIFAAVKDIILMVIGVALFSISFVRLAFGRFFARFLFNLAPFYQDEKEEWLDKFAKRVAPRTITIDEVTDNFRALLADPESMGFHQVESSTKFTSSAAPSSKKFTSVAHIPSDVGSAGEDHTSNSKELFSEANLKSLLFLQKSSLNLIDHHSSVANLSRAAAAVASASAATHDGGATSTTRNSALTTATATTADTNNTNTNTNINNINNSFTKRSKTLSRFVFDKKKGSILSTDSDDDDDHDETTNNNNSNNEDSFLAHHKNSHSSTQNNLLRHKQQQQQQQQKWIGGLPQTNKLWIEFGTVNRAMSALASKLQSFFHNSRSSFGGPSRRKLSPNIQMGEDSQRFVRTGLTNDESLHEDASAVKNYNNNHNKHNTVTSFDVVTSLNGRSTNALERDSTLEEDERSLFVDKKNSENNTNSNQEGAENRSYSPPLTELMDEHEKNTFQNGNDGQEAESLLPKGSGGSVGVSPTTTNEPQKQQNGEEPTNIASWAPPLDAKLDENGSDNDDDDDDDDELDIVHRDDFHLFERIILLRGKQLVKNASKPEVKKKFTALLFVWGKYDSHKLRFGLRKMNKREQKALQNFLEVAEFEDTVLELDMIKWRFTPQIWLMAFQFLFCIAYYIICSVQVLSTRKGDTVWNQYQSAMFRFMNSCTPIMLLTNSMLRRFYKEDLRPDFFFFGSLVLMCPAIITHVIPAIFIYIWVVVIALICLAFTLFIGEFFRKHGREVLHGFVARSNVSVLTASTSTVAPASAFSSSQNPSSPASPGTYYSKYDEDNMVVGTPSSPLDLHDKKVDAAVATPLTATQIAEQNTKTATVVSCAIYITFRVLVTLCVAVLLQTLFNYAVLFYSRDRLGLNYGEVVTYEWNSRTVMCPTWASGYGIANTLQLLSFLF